MAEKMRKKDENEYKIEGDYENGMVGVNMKKVREATNQLSLNRRQQVLLIVPLWCFRLGTGENYLRNIKLVLI